MRSFVLRTLGGLSLDADTGPLRIEDPAALGLVCLVLLGPDEGLELARASELLFPALDPAVAAGRLEDAVATVARVAGSPLLRRSGDRFVADRALLQCDVSRAASPDPVARDRFLAGFNLPRSTAFLAWADEVRGAVAPTAGVRAPQKRLRSVTTIAIGGASLLLLAAVYLTGSRPPAGFTRGDTVAVAALPAGDQGLTAVAVTTTAAALQVSRWLAPRPAEPVAGEPPAAAAAAAAVGARFLLGLAVAEEVDGVHATALLLDTERGDTVRRLALRAPADAGVAALVDQIADWTRAALGERRTERTAHRLPARSILDSLAR
ncbi:MAG: hypothetical protein AB7L66_02955 [Gemmatimonadales bacterium]